MGTLANYLSCVGAVAVSCRIFGAYHDAEAINMLVFCVTHWVCTDSKVFELQYFATVHVGGYLARLLGVLPLYSIIVMVKPNSALYGTRTFKGKKSWNRYTRSLIGHYRVHRVVHNIFRPDTAIPLAEAASYRIPARKRTGVYRFQYTLYFPVLIMQKFG